MWAGESGQSWEGATQIPVVLSVSFGYEDVDHWLDVAQGKTAGHIYSRNTNPTVAAFEEKIRDLETAEAATSFASGMAAISNTLFTLLSPGDRIVSIKDTYGGTNKLFVEFLPRFGIDVVLCDTGDHEAIEAVIAQGCKAVSVESPTNPTVKVVDLARLAVAAHRKRALVIVDNTLATPVNQQPLKLGADLVIHSATKFLGGHADALGGVACGAADLIAKIYHFREITGACLDPMAAYLLLRGMKTLHLRIARQNESALKIARFLESHPKVVKVFIRGWNPMSTMKLLAGRWKVLVVCSASPSTAVSKRLRTFFPVYVTRTWRQIWVRWKQLQVHLQPRAMSSPPGKNAQRPAFQRRSSAIQ